MSSHFTITQLQDEWKKDCPLEADLDIDSRKTPLLHHKYQVFTQQERDFNRILMKKKLKLDRMLTQYYKGAIDGRDIGREPFQQKLETKGQVESLVKSDDMMMELDDEITASNDRLLFLKEIVTQINNRSYLVHNAVEFMKWKQGQN